MEIEPEVLDCMEDLINKVVKKESNRRYYLKNKEKEKLRTKKYTQNNPQVKKRYYQSEKGKKSNRILNWKNSGVITPDWDALYDHHLKTTLCDFCNVVLTYDKKTTATTKCLDHDHSITDAPNFRNILCNSCNVKRK